MTSVLSLHPGRRIATIFICVALVASAAHAANEQLGPTYPIAEPNLLDEIYAQLKKKEASGELARLQKEAIERSKRHAVEPTPVDFLVRTVKPRRFYWDPTIRSNQEVTDTEGNVVVTKGQTVNPLDYVTLPRNMLFFDARDKDQIAKVRELMKVYGTQVQPIMVGGNIAEIQKQWKTRVFFDQSGEITRKLGIKQVPALVSQEGRKLRIDELAAK